MAAVPEADEVELAIPTPAVVDSDKVTRVEHLRVVGEWKKQYKALKSEYDKVVTAGTNLSKKYSDKKAEIAQLKKDKTALEAQVTALGGGGGSEVWVAKTGADNQYTVRPRHPCIKPFPTSPLPRQSLGRHPVQVGPPPRTRMLNGAIVRAAEPAIEQDYRVGPLPSLLFLTPLMLLAPTNGGSAHM